MLETVRGYYDSNKHKAPNGSNRVLIAAQDSQLTQRKRARVNKSGSAGSHPRGAGVHRGNHSAAAVRTRDQRNAGSDVTEGGDATFTVAPAAPSSDLSVSVTVTQSGDYGASTGAQTVTIPTGGSYTLWTVATTDDSSDEVDGSVTVTLSDGTGYTVSSSSGVATVAVSDDDVPEISIASEGDITEGSDATFTITASPTPHTALSVSVNLSQSGDYGVTTGAQTVTIPTGGSYTLTVATTDDSSDEVDGSVTATLSDGTGYTVSTSNGAASVTVADDDDPPAATPEISIAAGSDVTEGSDATFTITANPTPASSLDVTVEVSQSGDYGVTTGAQTVTIRRAAATP